MEKKSFNLSKFMKKSFYEGAKGYIVENERCMANCIKSKMSGKNKSRQEAYTECYKEYNTWDKGKWSKKYTACDLDFKSEDGCGNTPAAEAILKNKKSKE